MKIHDVAYCLRCKKFFHEDLKDGQGFVCCPNCEGAYRFNVITLTYSKEDRYTIELQDEFIISFHDKRQFKKLIKIFENLLNLSRKKSKEDKS